MGKRVAVFGASGQTGVLLTLQALGSSEVASVKAIVRNKAKMEGNLANQPLTEADKSKLTVVQVEDIFQEENLVPHLSDIDMVVSTLGFRVVRPSTNYLQSAKSIIGAMMKTSCRRYIGMHAWHTDRGSRRQAPFLFRYTILAYIAPLLDDMRSVEEYVAKEATEIDYTFVLPPGLNNKPVTDLPFKVAEGGWHVEGASAEVARADVARFILKIIEGDTYKKMNVAMATNMGSNNIFSIFKGQAEYAVK